MGGALVLALDTSGLTCGVGLAEEGRVLVEAVERTGWSHARRLMPLVDGAFTAAGRGPGELAAVAVTAGPGSWTGLRIGLATAQGLALALGIPVVPVGTLEALAWGAGQRPGPVCPVLDARRGGVYAAVFRWTDGELEPLLRPGRLTPAELLEEVGRLAGGPEEAGGDASRGATPYFVGEGLDVWGDEVGRRFGWGAVCPGPLRAVRPAAVAALGLKGFRNGRALDPAQVRPLYGEEGGVAALGRRA